MRAMAEGGAATNGVADTTMIQVQIMGELICGVTGHRISNTSGITRGICDMHTM